MVQTHSKFKEKPYQSSFGQVQTLKSAVMKAHLESRDSVPFRGSFKHLAENKLSNQSEGMSSRNGRARGKY